MYPASFHFKFQPGYLLSLFYPVTPAEYWNGVVE